MYLSTRIPISMLHRMPAYCHTSNDMLKLRERSTELDVAVRVCRQQRCVAHTASHSYTLR